MRTVWRRDDVEPQFGGVVLQELGDLVELYFLAEPRLRRAMTALGTARRFVREHAAAAEAILRDLIRHRLQCACIEGAGHAVRTVGAAIEQRLQIEAGDLAVVGDAGAEAHQHRMPAAMAVEDLLTRETDLYRTVEQQGSLGDDDLVVERIALAAEAAAVGCRDHSNVRGWHRQRLGQRAVQVVRRLRARVDDQLAVRILQGDGRVLLDRQMRVPLEEEHVVEHMVGAGDRLVHVAKLQRDGAVDVTEVAVVVDARLRMLEAVGRRREGPQRLVLDVDELDRALGGGLVVGDHRRYGIADEPDEVAAECVLVVADRQDAVGDREASPVSTRCTPSAAAARAVSQTGCVRADAVTAADDSAACAAA